MIPKVPGAADVTGAPEFEDPVWSWSAPLVPTQRSALRLSALPDCRARGDPGLCRCLAGGAGGRSGAGRAAGAAAARRPRAQPAAAGADALGHGGAAAAVGNARDDRPGLYRDAPAKNKVSAATPRPGPCTPRAVSPDCPS